MMCNVLLLLQAPAALHCWFVTRLRLHLCTGVRHTCTSCCVFLFTLRCFELAGYMFGRRCTWCEFWRLFLCSAHCVACVRPLLVGLCVVTSCVVYLFVCLFACFCLFVCVPVFACLCVRLLPAHHLGVLYFVLDRVDRVYDSRWHPTAPPR